MDWTEQERKLAQELNREDMRNFLEKVFVKVETQNGEEIKKNIVALDDAQYGQLMKVLYLVKKENRAKLQLLKTIAIKPKSDKQATAAPK